MKKHSEVPEFSIALNAWNALCLSLPDSQTKPYSKELSSASLLPKPRHVCRTCLTVGTRPSRTSQLPILGDEKPSCCLLSSLSYCLLIHPDASFTDTWLSFQKLLQKSQPSLHFEMLSTWKCKLQPALRKMFVWGLQTGAKVLFFLTELAPSPVSAEHVPSPHQKFTRMRRPS